MSERPIHVKPHKFWVILQFVLFIAIGALMATAYNKYEEEVGPIITMSEEALTNSENTIEQVNDVSGTVDSLNEIVSGNQSQLNDAIASLNTSLAELNEASGNNTEDVSKIQTDLVDINSQIDAINQALEEADDYDELIDAMDQLTTTINDITQDIVDLNLYLEETNDRLSELENPLELVSYSDFSENQDGYLYSYITLQNHAYYDIRDISQFFNIVVDYNDKPVVCELQGDSIFAGNTQLMTCRIQIDLEATGPPGNPRIEIRQE
jgi:septal ring factor EnvC (AmiA/AmiB activator)